MREVAELFGLAISTVWFIFKTVVNAVVSLQKRIIRWPDENRRRDIAAAVQQASGFPGVVGFLDGTHIRLSSAIGGDADYFNRKGYPSIQLQLTVDHDLVITSAYTGWPGCTHDARVLRNSQLYQRAENGEQFSNGEHLFADNAYPLRNWLISPFKNFGNLDARQRRFNMKLSSQRQCVERAIGHLKGRFRRLREIPLHNPAHICKVIIAACICHNLCVLCDDDIENFIENDVQADPNNYGNVYQNGYHGVARRMHLLQFV
ncbi:putative nuclease HARBI1 [Mercenaria mercenaria]|uniref:putative nuclease HARBI1 n=1 Tax=Mercenaria mercenaria TaxID=6596 RepID=UPI00234FAAD7|nr:putative nuclease HARBI1 [Mercenaria mercenaria]XP_053399129.1 putative nuclease HARBI1 [Mercenaria mercenaria]